MPRPDDAKHYGRSTHYDERSAQIPEAGNYAEVNGLTIYCEIHGTGQPLVLLPGAYMTIDAMGEVVPELARSRQVIAVELHPVATS